MTTSSVGLSSWFTLDETSRIRHIFNEQFGDSLNFGGDVGGSDMIVEVNPTIAVGSN